MAEEQTTSARPQPTAEQLELQKAAKRVAKEKGMDWKSMSQDERKEIKKSLRKTMPKKA